MLSSMGQGDPRGEHGIDDEALACVVSAECEASDNPAHCAIQCAMTSEGML